MIIDKNSSVDYKDWIEVSHDGNRQVTDQLMKALKSTKIDDFRSIHYLGEGVYVKGVAYDESTKVLTFTLSDGSSLSVKLTGDVDLSDYATKEDLNSKVDKVDGKVLSSNDFTSEEKSKLAELSNYDDSEIKSLIDTKANISDTYTKPEVDNLVSSVTTNLSWKESVPTFSDIAVKYPKPKDGWTVNVNDTDETYRYTGKEWIVISANSIPLATSKLDGKMSKDDKVKLDGLSNYDDSSLVAKVDLKADKSYVDTEISDLDSKAVKFSEFTYGGTTRNTIQLPNYDSISSVSTTGVGVNVAMVSKWDVVDLGSPSLPINLNTPKGVRPTAQEPGQTGETANKLAYLSDLDSYATKKELTEAINNLPEPIDAYTKEEVDNKLSEKVDIVPGMQLSHNDFTNDDKSKLDGIATGAQVNKIESIKINGLAQEIGIDDKSVDIDLSNKANIDDVYSKAEVDNKVQSKVDKVEGKSLISDSEIDRLSTVTNYDDTTIKGEVASHTADITSVLSRLSQLEDRVGTLNKTNIEPVVIEGTPTGELNDTTKDYQVSGNISSGTLVSIEGKSVSLSSVNLSNDSRLKLKATEDVDIKNSTISGDFPKTNGNSAISINNSGYVVIKDMTIDATLYNAIEIGLSEDSLVNGVLIDNCKFRGQFSNNAILIFGVKDNAVININNCYFENVSNCIRLSNKYNTKCTVNITNCTCDKWDTNSPWQGMMIFQDYTSKSLELEESNNLFSKDKVTINVSNFNGPSGKLEAPSDISSICGTGDENQVFYVWNSIGQSIPYGDGSRYPSINIV